MTRFPPGELLASYLDSEYRIVMAESGAEAVKRAKELRPDTITLDVFMPGRQWLRDAG
jgi:CheY-like chemotaxis protein